MLTVILFDKAKYENRNVTTIVVPYSGKKMKKLIVYVVFLLFCNSNVYALNYTGGIADGSDVAAGTEENINFNGTYKWNNQGSDSNFSTADNWVIEIDYPRDEYDNVSFDSTSTSACTVDTASTINNMVIENTYLSTVILSADLTVSNDLSIGSDATISTSTKNLTIKGSLAMSEGARIVGA